MNWIDVKVRLPNSLEDVLITDGHNVAEGFLTTQDSWYIYKDKGEINFITQWKPLPDNEWYNIKDILPTRRDYYWVYDGIEVFLASWQKCDEDESGETISHPKVLWWFGYQDGTETSCAYANITHWRRVEAPKAPEFTT